MMASTNYGIGFPSIINKKIFWSSISSEKVKLREKLMKILNLKDEKKTYSCCLIKNGWVVQSNNFNTYKNIAPYQQLRTLKFCWMKL